MTVSLNFIPPVIAHRGASAYAPENTLVAFTKAALLGIQWIEFDVTQSLDGVPIIFHDDTLDRTSNGTGDPSFYPFAVLRSLDAGSWFDFRFAGEKIPSFQQTLDFLIHTKMSANIEIKSTPYQEAHLIKKILQALADSPLGIVSEKILFSSFSISALKYLRESSPQCNLGLLLHEWTLDWEAVCQSLNCISLHVNEKIMTAAKAQAIKSNGKYLLCYTVNDPIRAAELYSWGVDAVFSDNPDRISFNVTL